MSQPPELFTNDDWTLFVTLKRDGDVVDVSGASDISAAVVTTNDDNTALLVGPVTASSGASGADWENGVVAITFPAASTGITDYGAAFVEVQVTDGGLKQTYPRVRVTVRKGIIA